MPKRTSRKPKRAPESDDAVERAIRAAYTEKEFRRLRQRLTWAVEEMRQVAERVPAVAARLASLPQTTEAAGPVLEVDSLHPESRAALTWLLDVLRNDPRQELAPTDRVQLQIVRGGRADAPATLLDLLGGRS